MTGRRRRHRRLAPVIVAIALVLPLVPASAAAVAAAPAPTAGSVTCQGAPGHVLVRYRATAGPSQKAAARATVHGKALHKYDLVPGLELLSTSMPVGRAVGRLRAEKSVAEAQPDCIVHASKLPNDPFFILNQWGLDNTGSYSGPLAGAVAGKDIDAPAGWDIRTDASSVKVAVIDTGMELGHEDLKANLWTNPGEVAGNHIDDDHNGYVDDVHGWDFANNDAVPADDNAHGTHVSGIIGARGNNNVGLAGVAWAVQLMPLKVLKADGSGNDSAIIAALQYAAKNGARITNNSYGGPGYDPALYNAFVAAGNAGMLQVVAAGNDGADNDVTPSSPADFRLDSVLSVAATDDTDALASFSNRGATTVDLGAPGVFIASTWLETVTPFEKYLFDSGTSMATPMVSGVAALVLAQNPTLSAPQLRAWIRGTVRPDPALVGNTVTGGVVDLGHALTAYSAVLALAAASDTGASTSDGITNAGSLTFDITFPRAVTGLAATDFARDGTATGCVIGALTGSGAVYHLQVTGCSAGTVRLVLAAGTVVDGAALAGPQVALHSRTVTIDRTAPTTTGLLVAPLAGTDLSGTSIRLHLTWAGADTGGTGVARYEAQVSLNGGTTWTNVSTTLPSPVANVIAASSGTVRYQVRAIDKAGNVGGYLPSPTLSPRLVQQTAAGITYTTGWTTASSVNYSGGSLKYATAAGKSATYKFTGRSIAFVTTRASNRGQVRIYVDGVLQATVNLAGATLYKDVAWQKTYTTSATRTFKAVVVGGGTHPRVDLDAFVVVS